MQSLAPAAAVAAARGAALVDYAAVAALKRPVLEALYRRFRAREQAAAARSAPLSARSSARAAKRSRRLPRSRHCTSISPRPAGRSRGTPGRWRLRDPNSAAVAEFARAHAERVGFFQFLQWQADRQLGAAAAAGHDGGLGIGLYRDLAVGVNPNGAEAWADQELVVPGMAIGAPPDLLNRAGQNWGLAPINPLALRRRGFAPLIAALRANMRHAGILRIDHVMSLQRLYWIPSGMSGPIGAYVNYPFRDLLRLVALESHRHGCAVIGEDLGTVPDGFRETMQAANVLSYRVVVFRTPRRRRLHPARRLSAAGRRLGRDARPCRR